jgi:opacity protein-like surface antigen
MTRLLFLFILTAASALCQPFSAGVKVGVPLSDFVDTARTQNFDYLAHTNRYLFGVTAELRLPFGLGVEVDALYRHFGFSGTGTGITANQTFSTTANAWEFPLLAKYRFGSTGPLRPFIDGGLAWDTLQGVSQVVTTGNLSTGTGVNQTTTRGIVLGAGLDVHALVIHLVPEVRYTRWGAQHFLDPNGGFHSNQNQAEFVLGIQF